MGECKEKEQGEEEEGGRGKQAGHLSLDSEKGRCPGSGRIHQKRKVQDSSASHMNSIVIRRNVSIWSQINLSLLLCFFAFASESRASQ